jgi:hypothetical protein
VQYIVTVEFIRDGDLLCMFVLFIYNLFNDAGSNSGYLLFNELERVRKEAVVA